MVVQRAYTHEIDTKNSTTDTVGITVREKNEKFLRVVSCASLMVDSFTDLLVQGLTMAMVLMHALE